MDSTASPFWMDLLANSPKRVEEEEEEEDVGWMDTFWFLIRSDMDLKEDVSVDAIFARFTPSSSSSSSCSFTEEDNDVEDSQSRNNDFLWLRRCVPSPQNADASCKNAER
mmetsp:Transcript_35701/g.52355  ORF Transcript_35701/g.52355 Transcript_35701/m.52355 type:complete len:110 (-) Transcript_35701:329-658(-)